MTLTNSTTEIELTLTDALSGQVVQTVPSTLLADLRALVGPDASVARFAIEVQSDLQGSHSSTPLAVTVHPTLSREDHSAKLRAAWETKQYPDAGSRITAHGQLWTVIGPGARAATILAESAHGLPTYLTRDADGAWVVALPSQRRI